MTNAKQPAKKNLARDSRKSQPVPQLVLGNKSVNEVEPIAALPAGKEAFDQQPVACTDGRFQATTPLSFHTSPEEQEQLRRKRQADFPTRTAGLGELAEIGSNLTEAVRKYYADPKLLCDDLDLVYRMLNGTLDGPSDLIPYSAESRDWLLSSCRSALAGLAKIIGLLKSLNAMPIESDVELRIAACLEMILDPEGGWNYEFEGSQHFEEAALAETGLLPLQNQIRSLQSWIELTDRTGPTGTAKAGVQAAPKPSGNFRSLYWFGNTYRFTPGQAGPIELLWKAWVDGTRYVTSTEICDASGGESKRVRDIFRVRRSVMHEAWGTMIRKKGNDQYFLQVPSNSKIPS